MFGLFKRSKSKTQEEPLSSTFDLSFLGCDMHSHIIPGVDDGAKTVEDSLDMVYGMKELGIKKLITTPHVYGDFYPNTKEQILEAGDHLNTVLKLHEVGMQVQASAEYFLDSYFLEKVLPHGLLSFGDNYVLVEISMAGKPINLHEMLFAVMAEGYKPILAHPERYVYENSASFFQEIRSMGVLMQMNILAPFGHYGKPVKDNADNYMREGLYDIFGTDFHHIHHQRIIRKMADRFSSAATRIQQYKPLLNTSLCTPQELETPVG